MKRRKKDEEMVNHVFTKPKAEDKSEKGTEGEAPSETKSSKETSIVVRHAKDTYLVVRDSGPNEEVTVYAPASNGAA